jgi:glutamine cyclotransferase
VIRINPNNGHVTGKLNFADILKKYSKMDLSYLSASPHGAVLNGIAWDTGRKKMFVTGKLWPLMFEVQLKP